MRITPISGYQYTTKINSSVKSQPSYRSEISDNKNEQANISFEGKGKSTLVSAMIALASLVPGKAIAQVNEPGVIKKILDGGERVVIGTGERKHWDTLQRIPIDYPSEEIGIYKRTSSFPQILTLDYSNPDYVNPVKCIDSYKNHFKLVTLSGKEVELTEDDFFMFYEGVKRGEFDDVPFVKRISDIDLNKPFTLYQGSLKKYQPDRRKGKLIEWQGKKH